MPAAEVIEPSAIPVWAQRLAAELSVWETYQAKYQNEMKFSQTLFI